MTHRTEHHQPTPVENATRDVLAVLSAAITAQHQHHGIARMNIPEKEFRRILALYFHNKSIADWCHDLSIADATDPDDKPSRGGEG